MGAYAQAIERHQQEVRQAMRTALRMTKGRWLALDAIPMLSCHFHVPGVPRCPVAMARAMLVFSHLTTGVWGPAPAKAAAREAFTQILDWARSYDGSEAPRPPRRRTMTLSRAAELIRQLGGDSPAPMSRSIARALYWGAWAAVSEQPAREWFIRKSHKRRGLRPHAANGIY